MEKDQLIVSLKQKPVLQEIPPPPPRPREGARHAHTQNSYVKYVVLGAVVVVLVGTGYTLYRSGVFASLGISDTLQAPQIKSAEEIAKEVEDVVTRVGKLIVLPQGEEPTVATVTDPALLKDQAFFANAKTGHKVLIYTQARKAFLYDPERNILIEAAPLVVDVP